MNEKNPYSPSDVSLEQDQEPNLSTKNARYLLCGLIGLQLLVTMYFAPTYWELVSVAATPLLALLLGLVGSLCLYISSLTAISARPRGKVGFMLAAILLGFAPSKWGGPYSWTYPMIAGAGLGLLGYWLVWQAQRSSRKINQ